MKKNSWILVVLSLLTFLSLRIHALSKKEKVYKFRQTKPEIPKPILVKSKGNLDPWIGDPWIEKDIALSQKICQEIQQENPHFTKSQLVETLALIQKTIPFELPQEFYNVLCLPEESSEYQIYQRLYLGETDLGLPFYLDVRVFPLSNDKDADNIVSKLLQKEESFSEKAYFVREEKTSYHGFEGVGLEYGLFFYPVLRGNFLYVAYARAPLNTFQKFLPLFESIHIKA